MGFFIRKSFSAGPIRLNLSKSGLGASVGVRGARVGVSSRGKAYVSGGRGGLYFREEISNRGARRSGSPRARDAILIEEDTGVTYSPQAPKASRREDTLQIPSAPNHHIVGTLLGFPVAAIFASAAAVALLEGATGFTTEQSAGPVFSLLFLAWPVFVARQVRQAWLAKQVRSQLWRAVVEGRSPTDLSACLSESKATRDDVLHAAHLAYVDLLSQILQDEHVDDEELSWLSDVEGALPIPPEFPRRAKLLAFQQHYVAAVADHDLSENEEAMLDHLRDRLQIPDSEIESELETLRQLRSIREIRHFGMDEITTSTKLQKDEVCYFEAEGRFLKRKNLQSFQQDGQKYKVQGLVVDKEGTLLITNKRVLLIHSGTSSIKHDRILDVELDVDSNVVSIVKDGVQKPVLITTPESQRASAILAVAADL